MTVSYGFPLTFGAAAKAPARGKSKIGKNPRLILKKDRNRPDAPSFRFRDPLESARITLLLWKTRFLTSGQNSSKALAAMRPAKLNDARIKAFCVLAPLGGRQVLEKKLLPRTAA